MSYIRAASGGRRDTLRPPPMLVYIRPGAYADVAAAGAGAAV